MAIKALFCDWLFSCAVAAMPTTPVSDLHYGTALYAYYQDDTEQALLETLVVERRGLVGDDPVRIDLAKGSFAFAEGLYRFAAETFDGVAPSSLEPIDRMRLSFHLAREYFRRGAWDQVEPLLGDIDLGTTWLGRERVHPEVEFMRAEIAARRGDFASARAAIDRIDEKSPHHAYALFNLGVAERAGGDLAAAEKTFAALASLDAYSEEALDLQQRALVALSILRRENRAAAGAEDILGALPSASRYRDLALTSYGGLAMDNGDYALAARVWMTLGQGDYWTQSNATARLAFPMSLEQMARRQEALMEYRATEARYEARLAELNGLVQKAGDPAWVGGLLQVFALPESAAGAEADARRNALVDEWRATLGHTDWFEWLADEDVHALLLEWRELNDIAVWLSALPTELDIFDGLSREQRRRTRETRETVAANGFAERRAAIAASLEAANRRIAILRGGAPTRTAEWMGALADPAQTELLADLAAKRALVERALDGAERDRWRARIDRLEGRVFWDLVDSHPTRVRELEKRSREAALMLAEIDERMNRVAAAEAAFVAGVETDFLGFQARADGIGRQVAVALADRELRLAEQIRGGIRREVAQIERQLLMTRMAIARTTDQLAFADEGQP